LANPLYTTPIYIIWWSSFFFRRFNQWNIIARLFCEEQVDCNVESKTFSWNSLRSFINKPIKKTGKILMNN